MMQYVLTIDGKIQVNINWLIAIKCNKCNYILSKMLHTVYI